MGVPGFSAEAALRGEDVSSRLRSRLATGPEAGPEAVIPQERSCDIGYIEGQSGLYVVCCDPDLDPPCVATGIV
jgi:hypothetical protein